MRVRPSPHAHWRRDDNRGERNDTHTNVRKKEKHHVTLLRQHESEIDATQVLTFLLMSGATTNRHVRVIMFQNIKFRHYASQVLDAKCQTVTEQHC